MRRTLTISILIVVILVALGVPLPTNAARVGPTGNHSEQTTPALAPPVASYQMDVRLDPQAKTVTGTGRITYRNPSPDTLNDVWLRLYLRAFRSADTLWMQESGGSHRGYGADDEQYGDIEVTSLSLNGQDLLPTTTMTDTLMHVPLLAPLAPQQSIEFDVGWTSTLPRVFARTGYGGRDDTFFMVGQWYPKMAVYDRGRWDTEPWHTNSEFFHDFGTYDVAITAPESYIVAGTGVPDGDARPNGDGTSTIRYEASSVTDFAWAASPDFRTRSAAVDGIEVVLFYLPEHEDLVAEYMKAATGSLAAFNSWYGMYPYPRLSVVDVPDNAGGAGGMEYPTLVTGGSLGAPGSGGVALVTAHEIGHQWWPMQTATNEGREPWLDEGLTEYSGSRYMVEAGTTIGWSNANITALTLDRTQYAVATDEPSTRPAWEYDDSAYGSAVYGKTSLGLWTLEGVVGTARFRQAMADYLQAYRWKHPTGADFRRSLETSLDGNLQWFFDDYLGGTGVIDYGVTAIEHGGTGTGGVSGDVVRLHREGTVRAPVEIRVVFQSGDEELVTWDGAEPTTDYTFPFDDPVVEVVVDPANKLVAELDRADNGMATQPLVAPSLTLGARLAAWAQIFVQLVGLFG
jgi:hypothetical protein